MAHTSKELFLSLREHAVWLRHCFNIYDRLYHSGPEYDEVLRKAANQFFHDLNKILIVYLIGLVGKITDPAESMGRKNLSILTMRDALQSDSLMTFRIAELTDALLCYGALLKPARNRIVAHSDLDAAMNNTRLGAHDETQMREFFENLQLYCDEVGRATGVGPSDFRHLPGEGDVIDLMALLRNYFDPDFPRDS